MVKYVLSWFETIFLNCAVWTDQLLTAVDGAGVVLAAFCIVLVIGLLFIPMRGNGMTNIVSYSKNVIHQKKKQNGKTSSKSSNSKKG